MLAHDGNGKNPMCTWRNPRKSETEQLKKWKQQARMSSRTKCQKRDWLRLLDGCPWWNGSRRNSNLWGEGNKNWIRYTIYIFLFSKIIQKLPPIVLSFPTSADDEWKFEFWPLHFEYREYYYLYTYTYRSMIPYFNTLLEISTQHICLQGGDFYEGVSLNLYYVGVFRECMSHMYVLMYNSKTRQVLKLCWL